MYNWQPIETAPLDMPVLLAVDSTDCGWVFDSAWWDEGAKCWMTTGTIKPTPLHMKYTHWCIPHLPDDKVPVMMPEEPPMEALRAGWEPWVNFRTFLGRRNALSAYNALRKLLSGNS